MNISNLKSTGSLTVRIKTVEKSIHSLQMKKKLLKKDMKRIKNSKTLDKAVIKAKLNNLKRRLKAVDNKIAGYEHNKMSIEKKIDKTTIENKMDELQTQKELKQIEQSDSYEKGETEPWDNTYSIVYENGKKKIKYNHPAKKNTHVL